MTAARIDDPQERLGDVAWIAYATRLAAEDARDLAVGTMGLDPSDFPVLSGADAFPELTPSQLAVLGRLIAQPVADVPILGGPHMPGLWPRNSLQHLDRKGCVRFTAGRAGVPPLARVTACGRATHAYHTACAAAGATP